MPPPPSTASFCRGNNGGLVEKRPVMLHLGLGMMRPAAVDITQSSYPGARLPLGGDGTRRAVAGVLVGPAAGGAGIAWEGEAPS